MADNGADARPGPGPAVRPKGRYGAVASWGVWPGWWRVAGVCLAVAGVVEAAQRKGDSGVVLPLVILLDLCATLPLVLARDHALAAAVTITVAVVPASALHRGPAVAGLLALVVVWTVVVRRRVRRRRAEAAERDASRRAFEDTLLEHTARGERARIARELHDVVAHHISMISVQAETARLATPGMPEEGARRLLAIGDTARTALTEMRRLLGVLREDAGAEPTRRPQPGLQQLLELVDETRGSGAAGTRLIVRGRVAALDPGVELTAYRIVQEALTNARRHAPGAAVDVEIDYAGEALVVSVRDNGPGPPPDHQHDQEHPGRRDDGGRGAGPGAGHGLLGMRERAAAMGGDLRTGPGPVGGFLVQATLPVAPAEEGTLP
ncbi:sensor histidine kinase [Actinomadura macra]|uniref:sensor histidine kinase n=1 Tax=Actinomadura macra TaxID=46164 RepID=UPI001C3F2995|nr:sensor histidine kinase [Actinomadura macra]